MKNCCCLWTISAITTWAPLLTGASVHVAWGSIHASCPQKMTCGQHGRKLLQKINNQEVNSLQMFEKNLSREAKPRNGHSHSWVYIPKALSIKGTWTQMSTAALVSTAKTENQQKFWQMNCKTGCGAYTWQRVTQPRKTDTKSKNLWRWEPQGWTSNNQALRGFSQTEGAMIYQGLSRQYFKKREREMRKNATQQETQNSKSNKRIHEKKIKHSDQLGIN